LLESAATRYNYLLRHFLLVHLVIHACRELALAVLSYYPVKEAAVSVHFLGHSLLPGHMVGVIAHFNSEININY